MGKKNTQNNLNLIGDSTEPEKRKIAKKKYENLFGLLPVLAYRSMIGLSITTAFLLLTKVILNGKTIAI